jgi:hypothetical protein
LGEVGGSVERFFGFWQVVQLNIAVSEARPGIPILRIFLSHLLEDRQGLRASALLVEL